MVYHVQKTLPWRGRRHMKVLLILLIVLIAVFVLMRAYETLHSATTATPARDRGNSGGASLRTELATGLRVALDGGGDDHNRLLPRAGFLDRGNRVFQRLVHVEEVGDLLHGVLRQS
jgi:hypothetical protein